MSFFKTLLASVLGFFLSLFLVFLVFLGIIIAAVSAKPEVTISDNSVLVINLKSSVPEYLSSEPIEYFMGQDRHLTMREYIDVLNDVRDDKRIPVIRLNLSGFAGSWAQAGELRAKLLEVKSAGKRIYAVASPEGINEIEYLIATVADSIILNPVSSIEINGISAMLMFYKPLLERLEIDVEVVRAGKFKSAVEPFILDSASSENRLMIESLVHATFEQFLDAVTASRHLTRNEIESIINNHALLVASEAHALKLVDAVMYEDEVRSLLQHQVYEVADSSKKLQEITIEEYAGAYDLVEETDESGNQIALVYAVGAIAPGTSRYSPNPLFGGNLVGSDTFIEAMRTARESKSVKVVVLRIDSPGGDASASDAMWREIDLTRQHKPVIVSMGSVAASGGYYIATAGDTIVADPTSITGSIGVFGLFLRTDRFLHEKLGINTQTFPTNPHADMMTGTRGSTDAERQILSSRIDTVYQRFLSVVSKGRKITIDSAHQLAQGRVWTGQQAREVGLVDVLGGLDSAIQIASRRIGLTKGKYSVRVLPRQKSIIDRISELFASETATIFSRRTAYDDLQTTLKEMHEMNAIQARMIDFKMY